MDKFFIGALNYHYYFGFKKPYSYMFFILDPEMIISNKRRYRKVYYI
jgi:hypothetical protein